MKGKMENAKAKYEWPQCFLMGNLRKGLEGRSFCLLFLVSATQRRFCRSFTLSSGGEQSCLVYSSTMHTQVEESHIKMVTNFIAVFAIISMKCRTTVYALNLFNKQDCIR